MDPSKIRVIFFDVHETLIHIAYSPPEIFHALCEEVGVEVSLTAVLEKYPVPEELERRREAHGNDIDFWIAFNNSLVAELGLSDPSGSLAQFITEGFTRHAWWKPYAEAESVLKELKSMGFKIAVIANARDLVLGRLDQVGLTHLFDSITFSDEVGVPKPDPLIFRTALERVGVQPQEAIHIGDRMKEDVEGATAAGINAVLLDRKNDFPEFEGLKVEDLRGLLEILSRPSP